MRPDAESWNPIWRFQVFWPRVFTPPLPDNADAVGVSGKSVRLVRVLHEIAAFGLIGLIVLFGLFGNFVFLEWLKDVMPPLSQDAVTTAMLAAFIALIGTVGLMFIILELIVRRLTLPNAVATRPFPVGLLLNSVVILICAVLAVLAYLRFLALLT
jgi:hypothetical protein